MQLPHRTWFCMALCACQPPFYGLMQVPIDGASAHEEAELRRELELLLETLDARSVMVSSVDVVDTLADGEISGRYDDLHRRIKVKRTDIPYMRLTLRHEVCHAMDIQLGHISKGHRSAAMETFRRTSNDEDRYPTIPQQRREGFAQLCELGAGGLQALAVSEDPSDLMAEAAAWMLDETVLTQPEATDVFYWSADLQRPDVRVFESGVLLKITSNDLAFLDWEGEPTTIDAISGAKELSFVNQGRDVLEQGTPFEGSVFSAVQTASGAVVLYGTPDGGRRLSTFVRPPGGDWAFLGTAPGGVIQIPVRQEVVLAYEDQEGLYRIDRIP